MATRQQASAALESLNPAPVFLEAYLSQRLPENLELYFGPPEELFAAGNQNRLTECGLIPILDDGNLGIITFLDPAGGTLVQKDIESPREVLAKFENWQQYLADLMLRIAESIDDESALYRIAELIGFRHFKELMSFLRAHENEPDVEYYVSRRLFIAGLQTA